MDYEVKTVIDNIDDMTDIIKNQLNDIAEGFVSVGYYLRKTDETMLYKQKGYKTIYEYAKDTFGIGRSTASRFMEINQKYSKDGYSPEIDLKWSGYGSSKLTEMLGLPEDVQEAIPVDATVRDIREAREIPLSSIDEWKNLPATISYAGLEKPDFGYYRNPIKNEIDRSPCGVSIFESGMDQLESVDTQNARLKWEFESGERAINVSTTALQPIVGEDGRLETPKLDKRLYRGLNLDAGDDGDLYKEWSPEFRDISIINGLNQFLRQLEFNVSLSYGDLSDVTDVDKTATEVKIAKKRKYNMVSAIQENLKDCLEDLVYALAFYNAKLHSGYEFNCTFKDSILVDDETERQNDRADVSLGAMQLWEYRMKHYAEDEETAKKMVVQQADVIED
jgi:hypothetical protein